ncbi:hypothetical protein HPB50_009958 [Hyalomma asiaticum]|uniref:Uncharacterized protein n=1 Tax=Hyalomma asiaticum TaxID=266040 RepID=A0ACB7RI40_HYAAI|nr:hypothetical protein HPB50_009958 [Hyalomma asiaticum]
MSYCLRIGVQPLEIFQLFGPLPPSTGHWKRICKMLRSELYRQVRHLQDWLYHVCLKSEKPWAVSSRLRRLRCSTAALTEVFWNQLRASLPKKQRRCAADTPVAYLDGASLPPNFDELLKMGPKFSLEPRAQKHELLATVHRVAAKAPSEERTRCISEGVDCLLSTWGNNRKGKDLRLIVGHFEQNHLRLLQADKEGAFVVMPSSAFDFKASEAIQKNFKLSTYKPRKAKAVALRLISELNLDGHSRQECSSPCVDTKERCCSSEGDNDGEPAMS